MPRGLPHNYIKQYGVTKKAWREYRKAQGKGKTKRAKSNPKPKARRRTMARKKRRGKRKFTIPLTVVLPMALGSAFVPGKTGWGGNAFDEAKAGRLKQAGDHLLMGWTGFDRQGRWHMDGMNHLKMTGVGLVIHYVLSKLGVNRMLGRAGVPVIRV